MPLVKSENTMPNSYHVIESDNFWKEELKEELFNNINRLEELKKRLSFTLREIDLCINRG